MLSNLYLLNAFAKGFHTVFLFFQKTYLFIIVVMDPQRNTYLDKLYFSLSAMYLEVLTEL